jgi:hypothetical protein
LVVGQQLLVGGESFPLVLQRLPEKTKRKSDYAAIRAAGTQAVDGRYTVVTKNVRLNSRALPHKVRFLAAQVIPHCRGIFSTLRHGYSNPRFTFLID